MLTDILSSFKTFLQISHFVICIFLSSLFQHYTMRVLQVKNAGFNTLKRKTPPRDGEVFA